MPRLRRIQTMLRFGRRRHGDADVLAAVQRVAAAEACGDIGPWAQVRRPASCTGTSGAAGFGRGLPGRSACSEAQVHDDNAHTMQPTRQTGC